MTPSSRLPKFKVGLLVAALSALLLGACAPAAGSGGGPLVAILNAPAESRLAGAAERLQNDLLRDAPLGFRLVSSGAMRFQENHNDFFRSRAAGTAGRVARSYGADIAVMVGAAVLKRDVNVSADKQSRRVDVSVQMQAVMVDAATDAILSTQFASLLHASRTESNSQPLVDIQLDPDVRTLRDQGVDSIARTIEATLHDLLGIEPVSEPNAG